MGFHKQPAMRTLQGHAKQVRSTRFFYSYAGQIINATPQMRTQRGNHGTGFDTSASENLLHPPIGERIGTLIAGVTCMAFDPTPVNGVPLLRNQLIQLLP